MGDASTLVAVEVHNEGFAVEVRGAHLKTEATRFR